MLVVDLGQSGARIKFEGQTTLLTRGKLNGESVHAALKSVFELLPHMQSELVALSCTGFNGIVKNEIELFELCKVFFGARKVAVIDDGLAGFIGANEGKNGVVLTLGGGVVAVGGNKGIFSHRDGLGSTFGDEGGGFWLGKNAITKALGIRQGRGSDMEMLDYFRLECDAFDNLEVKNGSDAATLAINSAKKVLDASDLGIKTAVSIVTEGAFLLSQTLVAAWEGCRGERNEKMEFVIQGGLSRNLNYVSKISDLVIEKLPSAILVKPSGDNLDGANWIAQNMYTDSPPLLRWVS